MERALPTQCRSSTYPQLLLTWNLENSFQLISLFTHHYPHSHSTLSSRLFHLPQPSTLNSFPAFATSRPPPPPPLLSLLVEFPVAILTERFSLTPKHFGRSEFPHISMGFTQSSNHRSIDSSEVRPFIPPLCSRHSHSAVRVAEQVDRSILTKPSHQSPQIT